ncbi:hypothetical protein GDR29_03540 [Xanthomonas oryzae pv. oryzae]|nr:hypothetical protein GDR29_03540 [Xanthomonas oryzae pv. oryzae]
MDPAQQLDDPPLDAEELEAAASLTSDDIQAIDCALIAASRASWSKVALVVSVAMDAYPDAYCDIPDIFLCATNPLSRLGWSPGSLRKLESHALQ